MSKLLWTSQEAAKATAGRAIGDWAVSGLSIDSRSIQAGEMFVPLKDTRDGHDFIAWLICQLKPNTACLKWG